LAEAPLLIISTGLLIFAVGCSQSDLQEQPSEVLVTDRRLLAPETAARWLPPVSSEQYESIHERPVLLDVFGDGTRGEIGFNTRQNLQRLSGPSGIATDQYGNLYISDHSASTIRRVDPDGTVTVVAGRGSRGDDGDGGLAIEAMLWDPSWLLVDGVGVVFVSTNNKIRRVDTDGTISTVAGTGHPGFDGDGQQASLSQLNSNSGMAVDQEGNLYFADRGNDRVRRISRGGVITTVLGDTFVSSIVAGDGAMSGRLQGPTDVAVARDGAIYVAEFDGHRVLRMNRDGSVTVVAGTGTPGFSGDGGPGQLAQLHSPRALSLDALGNLYIADWTNQAIRRLDRSGNILTVAGLGTSRTREVASAMTAGLSPPIDLALGPSGYLYLLQQSTYTVSLLRAPSIADSVVACQGDLTALTASPAFIAQDALAVLLAGSAGPGYQGDGGPLGSAQFLSPESVVIARDGTIYIADTGNHRIRLVSTDGVVSTLAGTGEPGFSGDGGPSQRAAITAPKALMLDSAGNLYFTDSGNFRLRRIDRCGIIESIAGSGHPGDGGDGGPAVAAQFRDATGLAMDSTGNIYVADPASDRVRKIASDGIIVTFAGTGQDGSGDDGGYANETSLDGPSDVVVGQDGTVYIAEMRSQKIRAVSTDGIISTVAPPRYQGLSEPDSTSADSTSSVQQEVFLQNPISLTLDDEDRIYVAELTGGIISAFAPGESPRRVVGDPAGQGSSGGDALDLAIPAPLSLALDVAGNLYVLNVSGELWQLGDGSGVVGAEFQANSI
jgi:hypothetical protein